ncbi:MAG: hypothetical protein P8N26_04775 [Cyclobacteriaceae bacterium]|nr:hypothetical protein [Cyclobacteriaceae bacterium]
MAVDSSIIHAFLYYGMAGGFRMVILTNISLLTYRAYACFYVGN